MTRIIASLRAAGPFGLVAVMLLLSGCQTVDTRPDESDGPGPVVVEPPVEPERPATLQDVILALDAGELETAERQLLDILDRRPGSRLANRLLEQLRGDPEALMGGDYREVVVAEGETLSEIAERELGDALQFFALARYNGIGVPRQLEPGRTLRIPEALRASPEALEDAPEETPDALVEVLDDSTVDSMVDSMVDTRAETPQDERDVAMVTTDQAECLDETIQGLIENGRHDLARDLLTLVAYAGQLDATGAGLLVRATLASVTEREALGDLETAVDLLDASRTLVSAAAGAALSAERDRIESRLAYAEGLELQRADRLDEALERLELSAALDPTFAAAREEAARVREMMVQRRHEAALVHYREQRLDAAIELWQGVVKLDPDFEPAQRYLARARDLRTRLKALD